MHSRKYSNFHPGMYEIEFIQWFQTMFSPVSEYHRLIIINKWFSTHRKGKESCSTQIVISEYSPYAEYKDIHHYVLTWYSYQSSYKKLVCVPSILLYIFSMKKKTAIVRCDNDAVIRSSIRLYDNINSYLSYANRPFYYRQNNECVPTWLNVFSFE